MVEKKKSSISFIVKIVLKFEPKVNMFKQVMHIRDTIDHNFIGRNIKGMVNVQVKMMAASHRDWKNQRSDWNWNEFQKTGECPPKNAFAENEPLLNAPNEMPRKTQILNK